MSEGTSGVDSTPPRPRVGSRCGRGSSSPAVVGYRRRGRGSCTRSPMHFDRASLQPGERGLDVGVGSGPTTGQAWEAVRPDGSVTGIDIAPPMIAAARQRVIAPEIEWIVGDAASYDFPPRTYDAVISRLGVMFFTDPVAGFHNLCEATRPGGRLIVTVWSNLYATGLFGIPYTVATTTLHRLGGVPRLPPDGILFSLGRPETIREVLNAAGWTDVETAVDNRLVHLPPDPLAAAKMTMMSGPVGRCSKASPRWFAEAEAALAADYTHRQNESGIGLPSGFIVVVARRS